MGKFSIKQIGKGELGYSKKGNRFIHLNLDVKALEHMAEHDFGKGIYVMMENLNVICPMPEEYEPNR